MTVANSQGISLLIDALIIRHNIYISISPCTTQTIGEMTVSCPYPVDYLSEGRIYLHLCHMAFRPIAIADFDEHQTPMTIIVHCLPSPFFGRFGLTTAPASG